MTVTKRTIAISLLALVVSACGTRVAPAPVVISPVVPSSLPAPAMPGATQQPVADPAQAPAWEPDGNTTFMPRWTTNAARLLVDKDEIFPAMEALVQRAQRLIQIDYYIFSGQQAQRVADILKQKVRQGVTVEMMLDPKLGTLPEISRASRPIVNELLAAGAQLREYPLKQLQQQVGKSTIVDHSKIIVVDGREAMVGGMNIADPFLNNHDLMVEIAGPAAQDLAQNLRHDFRKAESFKTQQAFPGEMAEVRVNSVGLSRNFNKEAVLAAINNARQSVHVLMFQLTHPELIDALIKAHQRGVDVKVILDPGDHDNLVPLIKKAPKGFPNLPAALDLKKAGVPVRWYTLKPHQDHMHAKAAVVDGMVAFVGSTNWTTNGFHNNNETSLEVRGGSVPPRLQQVFLHDWHVQSEPVNDDEKLLSGLKAWLVRQIYFP